MLARRRCMRRLNRVGPAASTMGEAARTRRCTRACIENSVRRICTRARGPFSRGLHTLTSTTSTFPAPARLSPSVGKGLRNGYHIGEPLVYV